MPSGCFIPNYLYLVPILLNGIGNLFAHVAAVFVTSVCRLLNLRG